MISNIEKINNHFKLPIFYNDKKVELNSHIIKDLELIESIDDSCKPLLSFAFCPKTKMGEKVMEQITEYYTTDKEFLKDSQTLIKKYKMEREQEQEQEQEQKQEPSNLNNIIKIWDEIKNDNGFREKYQYIDWSVMEHLNKSESFLQIMSVYSIIAPLLSLLVPIIVVIIPFFIIQIKGLRIGINEYIEILKTIIGNHAIGKLFTQFNTVETGEKIYIFVSAAFYLFSIYQNVISCLKFHQNMKKIHNYFDNIKTYIKNTVKKMDNMLNYTISLKTYQKFNDELTTNKIFLTGFYTKLEKLMPYQFHIKKLNELGSILKYFYDLYSEPVYESAFLYSFGFNGYIDNLNGLSNNINEKHINFAKFTNKKKINCFKKAYYPALIHNSPIKNSIKLDKNLIITGPNASGKTTVLKTALINVVLTQQFGCGFYESAIINPYKYIHCYLNIPDTSGRDSLFQAEARRCKEIIDTINVNASNEMHFCIFDELYSGTNPEDAVSSASAFLKYITKFKNVNCLLTTHFIDLCYKMKKNECIENYHMKTDTTDANNKLENDFKYTYLLKKGISEIRGGIKVLNDMNYPKEIIDETNNNNNYNK